jgi:transposase
MIKINVEKVATTKEITKVIGSEQTKSAKMKELFLMGVDIKEIAKLMETRYNFVYNVVSNMIRMNDMEEVVVKDRKEGKKDEIIKLLNEGHSNIEISKILKSPYNYVWKVVNEELASKK